MQEVSSEIYAVRTRWNVRDSDATVVFTRGAPTGGSALTLDIARKMGRPVLHLDLHRLDLTSAIEALERWLLESRPSILNVAGSRESQAPGIEEQVRSVLMKAVEYLLDADDPMS